MSFGTYEGSLVGFSAPSVAEITSEETGDEIMKQEFAFTAS